MKPAGPSREGGSRPDDRLWLWLTCLSLLSVALAATRWIFEHPFAIHWDEALYFNNVLRDIHDLHSGSLRQFASIFVGGDIRRPPANLLLALPFLAVFGFHTAVARLVTLACWGVSGWITYLTARRLVSPAAGMLAVLVFCLSPEVISASIFFSTEGPIFLATAMLFYFASTYWSDGTDEPRNWIGLGVAVGIGILAKSTFVLIAGPALLATYYFSLRHRSSLAAFLSFLKAGVVAFLVAGPWWLKNLRPAFNYMLYARDQPRNSLGTPSLATWAKWLFTVGMSLIGPGLSILIAILLGAAIRKYVFKKDAGLDLPRRAALATCGCAIFPLVAMQLSGTNHLLRYLAPLMIPFAIAVGVLAESTGWIRMRTAAGVTFVLAGIQLLMLVYPVLRPNRQPVDPGFYNGGLPWRIMVRFEQWDWAPVHEIAQDCGLSRPKIAFLGMGRPLNPAQIEYPWFLAGESPSEKNGYTEPLWLWRYEEGPFNWAPVMTGADESDIVLTAPTFVGQATDRQEFDNVHNREFGERVASDPLFRGPIRLQMGRFGPVEVLVFVKSGLACHSTAMAEGAR